MEVKLRQHQGGRASAECGSRGGDCCCCGGGTSVIEAWLDMGHGRRRRGLRHGGDAMVVFSQVGGLGLVMVACRGGDPARR